MCDPNSTPKPYRQVLLSDEELEYGLYVRPDLPPLTDEQKRTWETVPWEPIATLTAEPEEIAERFGLTFQHTIDGLDHLRLAVVDLEEGVRIAFKRHRGIRAGTYLEIMLMRDFHAEIDTIHNEALQRVVDGLKLSPADFDWIRPKSTPGPTS